MLNKQVIRDVLAAALSTGGDFAEIYVEDRFNNSIEMVKGKVEKSLSGRDYGIGIRIFQGFNSVYTYTCENTVGHLVEVAKKVEELRPDWHFTFDDNRSLLRFKYTVVQG